MTPSEEKDVREARIGRLKDSLEAPRLVAGDTVSDVRSDDLSWLLAALQSAEQERDAERAMRITAAEERGDAFAQLNRAERRIAELETHVEYQDKALGFAQNGRCAAEAQLAEVVEAARPFAAKAQSLSGSDDRLEFTGLYVGDFRRLARALTSINKEQEPVEFACGICGASECDGHLLPAQDVGGLVERCPKCGSQVTPDWTYCKACGETNPAALSPRPVQPQAVPDDIARLVIAARIVAHEDQGKEALAELDQAVEEFASRVPWDDEPVQPQGERS
jgi:hypothetical protein